MVIGGEFAIEAARKSLRHNLMAQDARRSVTPTWTFIEARESTGGHELSGSFSDEMVVRRRAAAGKCGEPLLMVVELIKELRILLRTVQRPLAILAITAEPIPMRSDGSRAQCR